ncbi:MAG: hypothetical protein FJ265_19875 [Planctomycetes bacterium]|nr:hypothetical protein [Planctomycetota bacterium]
MSRALLDPRVWLPAALAALLLGSREALRPGSPTSPAAAAAVELPTPKLVPAGPRDQAYDLDAARSSVRFLVEGEGRELLATCSVTSGRLDLRADAPSSTIELQLDLGSLVPAAGDGTALPEAELLHLLGVHRGVEVSYRGTLTSTTTAPLPGLVHRLWTGSFRFGHRAVRQQVGLWQAALPGQPLRLQGYGTVVADDYGLPVRSWLGFAPERHAITLGLDLAWRRRPSH